MFLECQYKWHVRYIRGLDARVDRPAPVVGSAIHRGVAAVWLKEDPFGAIRRWFDEQIAGRDLWEEELEQYQNCMADALDVVEDLLATFPFDRWNPLAVETEFSRPLLPGYRFGGIIDLLAEDQQTGGIWLIDVKARAALAQPEQEQFDLQLAAYESVLHFHGTPLLGSQILQVRRKPPAKPTRNKNGSMSRVHIATNWRTYKGSLIEWGLDPDDYDDMREKLADYESFRHSLVFRPKDEAEAVFEEIVLPVANRIVGWDEDQMPVRHPNRDCIRCFAFPICSEALKGRDTSFIEETQFVGNLHATR